MELVNPLVNPFNPASSSTKDFHDYGNNLGGNVINGVDILPTRTPASHTLTIAKENVEITPLITYQWMLFEGYSQIM
jgi:hypothetical protein